MKKLLTKHFEIILPYLISCIIAMVAWLWNFQIWRSEIDKKISQNYCAILTQLVTSKKEDLFFKQSSIPANINADNKDALEYYRFIEKETINLNEDIRGLEKQQEKNGC